VPESSFLKPLSPFYLRARRSPSLPKSERRPTSSPHGNSSSPGLKRRPSFANRNGPLSFFFADGKSFQSRGILHGPVAPRGPRLFCSPPSPQGRRREIFSPERGFFFSNILHPPKTEMPLLLACPRLSPPPKFMDRFLFRKAEERRIRGPPPPPNPFPTGAQSFFFAKVKATPPKQNSKRVRYHLFSFLQKIFSPLPLRAPESGNSFSSVGEESFSFFLFPAFFELPGLALVHTSSF